MSGEREREEDRDGGQSLPPRLCADGGREGEFVRRYLRGPHGASEEKAWARLEEARRAGAVGPAAGGSRGARAAAVVAGSAALAAIAVVVVLALAPRRTPSPIVSRPELSAVGGRPGELGLNLPRRRRPAAAAAGPADAAGGKPEAIALGPGPRPLAAGRWTLAGEASVEIAAGSVARADVTAGGSATVRLVSGQIALTVVAKPRSSPFRVIARPYVFTVLGTVFTVQRGPATVGLIVNEGRVAVARKGRRLATVAAGGSWSGPSGASPRPSPSPVPKPAELTQVPEPSKLRELAVLPAPAVLPVDQRREPSALVGERAPCAAVAPGQSRRTRVPCLRARAAGSGLVAETALYEIGRITREDVRDPAAALATFQELRRRFPNGTLRVETDLSIVELLARMGRHRAALDESAALLDRGAGAERVAELRLLRGNLYREAEGDLARAADEYRMAAAQASRAPAADEAAFLHAVTLEALGRRAEAVEGYRQYLARPRPAHGQEAGARLEGLRQTSNVEPGSK